MMLDGVSPFKRRKAAKELLSAVDLDEHIHKKPSQLSGGQQQRVAIAVSLANQPKLLLADEPTGALDRESAMSVMDLLMDLRERYGLTILMVTHDAAVSSYADRVLTLRDGALGQDMSEQTQPELDAEGRIQLPKNVRATLSEAASISVEIRPEGVLLRPESEDIDNTEALLISMLPQDAPPEKRNIFTRVGRLFKRIRSQK
jgi:ABC-type methionine transport system ATPase subunit